MHFFPHVKKKLSMRSLANTPEYLAKTADILKSEISVLPDIDITGMPPSEAAWAGSMNRLKELASGGADPMQFLQWDVIRQTMFVGSPHFVKIELAFLKRMKDWNTRWEKAIQEAAIGSPLLTKYYKKSSGNLIHHMYHLSQFEQKTGRAIDKFNTIVEFGGGYGSMCRACHNLGFKGRYIIFDLPHFSILQRFFLKALNLPVMQPTDNFCNAVHCTSELNDVQNLIGLTNDSENRLFIATWSLSETPDQVRQSFTGFVQNFDAYLIAYQHRFGEVDNVKYFAEWQSRIRSISNWFDWEIPHLKGSNYLMGYGRED
jgi:hypothetical protein